MQHIFILYFGDEFIVTKPNHKINVFRFGDALKSSIMFKKMPL